MSIKESKEGVVLSRDRKMPSTTATQFADNSEKPFWSFKDSVSASDDFFDCYVAFKELSFHEYFWDWQGRKLDELLIQKLMQSYKPFFMENQIGKNHFITFRVGQSIGLEELGKVYMSIISSNHFASSQKMFSPPLFEMVHSSTSPDALMRFAKLYKETVSMASDQFRQDCKPKVVSLMPEHDVDGKVNWYSSLSKYLEGFQSAFRCKLDYVRPLIPRSSMADSLGFVGAVLETKRALASYAAFSRITGVDAYPVIDSGTLMFRGGLTPSSVKGFVSTYHGARTVAISSAFRYDYNLRTVKEAILSLNDAMPRNSPDDYSKEDLSKLLVLINIFAKNYSKAMKALPSLDDVAKSILCVNKNAAKSITKSFSLYSLGVPPEMVGTGRALVECIKSGHVKDLERFYPNIKKDLVTAGKLLNKENLKLLSQSGKGWKGILDDVHLIEDFTDSVLGPDSADTFMHRNYTSNVFHLRTIKKEFGGSIAMAAKLRRALG